MNPIPDPAARPLFVRAAESLRRAFGYQFPPMGPLVFRAVMSRMPRECWIELVPGIHIRADFTDNTFVSTYWRGRRFEGDTLDRLINWLRECDTPVFFDIGSNYGFYSYQALWRVPRTRVHAFEPNPRTFARLEEAVCVNHLTPMRAHPIGLSDTRGQLDLHHGTEDQGQSTFGEHPEFTGTTRSRVDIWPFDEWLATQPSGLLNTAPLNWVAKIDVEGFEPRVLRGMRASLKARRFRGLMVEINPFTLSLVGSSPAEIYQVMQEYDYIPLLPRGDDQSFMNQFFAPRI